MEWEPSQLHVTASHCLCGILLCAVRAPIGPAGLLDSFDNIHSSECHDVCAVSLVIHRGEFLSCKLCMSSVFTARVAFRCGVLSMLLATVCGNDEKFVGSSFVAL